MINTSRIVPIESVDLLTMYGTIMKLAGTSVTKIDAADVATFDIASGSGNLLASEPVKKFNFGASVTSATIYFVAAYDFDGFYAAGTKVTTSGVAVVPDGKTLYTATISGTSVTIAQVGF